jgi:hypothetical protein
MDGKHSNGAPRTYPIHYGGGLCGGVVWVLLFREHRRECAGAGAMGCDGRLVCCTTITKTAGDRTEQAQRKTGGGEGRAEGWRELGCGIADGNVL